MVSRRATWGGGGGDAVSAAVPRPGADRCSALISRPISPGSGLWKNLLIFPISDPRASQQGVVLAGRRAGQRWVDGHREVGEGCTEREGERWRQRRDGETVMGVGREITERDEGTVRARDRNPTPKTAPGKQRPGSTRQTQAEKNIQGHSEREQTHGVRAQSQGGRTWGRRSREG